MTAPDHADVHQRITAEIMAAIQAGAGDSRLPWHHDGSPPSRPLNIASAPAYRGVNVLALWVASHASGYSGGHWGTYRQWQALGAQVRKGERATTVVLWKPHTGAADDSGAESLEQPRRLFARAFSVFNADQVDGYEAAPSPAALPASERLARADSFFEALKLRLVHGAECAHYRIVEDAIHMPAFERFHDAVGYYGTLLHEAAHATGAKHRLNRDFAERFSREALAMEEITAELTAGFVLADLGLAHHPRRDHAAYVGSWLRVLKNDPRAVFAAAGKAQAAADWMHAQQNAVASGTGER